MTALADLATRWPRLNALLDQALDVSPAERVAWVDALEGEPAELKDTLRRLLEARAGVDTKDFLSTLPRLDTPTPAAGAELREGVTIGPYRLVRELGHGGMGAVWLAERSDGQLKRNVALKLPHLGWGGNLAERLARERDILATLEHPNIARLYDAGVDALGRPWMAMEYVQGHAIDAFVRERALSVRDIVALLLQVCAAVAHAHSRLVIHRDLKPSNILVEPGQGAALGRVRLLDFGIAKLMEGEHAEETALTRAAGRALTPDYASPEQIRGEPLTTASDVYSLAVLAYRLLSGQGPYALARGSTAELEEAIAGADVPLASQRAQTAALQQALRGDLDAILNRALKKNPAERYATVDAMAQDLARHLAGEAVSARPDSAWSRVRRLSLRHRRPIIAAAVVIAAFGLGIGAGATALVILALLLGLAAALWQARRAASQAREARAQARRAEDTKRFVLSIFESAETTSGTTRHTTAIELLTQARARLQAAPPEDASTRVELLTSIGFSTLLLGDPATAEGVLDQAVRLASEQLPAADARRSAAELALGRTVLLRGDPVRAGPLIAAAEAAARAQPASPMLVEALRWKANLHIARAEHDAAIEAARESVDVAERLPRTSEGRRAAIQANIIASHALVVPQRPGSLPYARRALELALDLHRDERAPSVLFARGQLAAALTCDGRYDEADAELRTLAQREAEVLGPSHSQLGQTHGRIGMVAARRGDAQGAVQGYAKAVEVARAISPGSRSRDVVAHTNNLAAVLVQARRYDEAIPVLDAGLQAALAFGPDDPGVFLNRLDRAHLLLRTGCIDAAAVLLDATDWSSGLPVRWKSMLEAHRAQLRSLQGRHDEAEAAATQALATVGTQARNALDRGALLCLLGQVRVRAARMAPAAEALEQGLEVLGRIQSLVTPDRAEAMSALAVARSALGRHGAARAAARAAVAFWNDYAPDHVEAVMARQIEHHVLQAAEAATGIT